MATIDEILANPEDYTRSASGDSFPNTPDFLALVAEIGRLRDRNERLERMLTEPVFTKAERTGDGGLEISFEPCLGAKVLAASFAEQLGDAKNWQSVEIGPMPSDQGLIVVTARRMNGQTPEETVGELRREIERLRSLPRTDKGMFDECREDLKRTRADRDAIRHPPGTLRDRRVMAERMGHRRSAAVDGHDEGHRGPADRK